MKDFVKNILIRILKLNLSVENLKEFYIWQNINNFSEPLPQFVKEKVFNKYNLTNSVWIETGTYLIAAAATEVNLKIKNIIPKIIKTEIDTLRKIGTKIVVKKNQINVIGKKIIKSINIKTAPYPGFPTDLQAQLMVLLCKANKKSLIKEDIFENRFMHVAELNRMGAQISINGNKAIIQGNINFAAAELMATDLRASVSLILAALTANGKSVINRIYHLDRGYENIEKKLKKIGARIRRIK